MKDKSCCQIAVGVLYNKTLITLDLSNNLLSMAAGISLGKVIRVHKKLRNLDLSDNDMGTKALTEITRGLTINKSIRNAIL